MGSGTVTLSGTNNYTGGTSIAGGIVVANGNASTGTGPVLVEQGGVLSGTGSVAGDVWIGVQGTLSPGVSPGVLPIGSDLVFSNFSSVYVAELDNPTPAGVDRLDLSGDIDLNNATLDLQRDPGYLPTASDTLVIATYGGNITGTFNNLPEGAPLSAQGEAFTISYTAGQVTLTATGDQRVYAGPDTMTRTDTNSVSVDLATLLANDLVGAGPGPLAILSVMPNGVNGGGITLSNDMVTYTPPPGYTGGDSFSYVVSDGTDNAIGLVNVQVGSTPSGVAAVGDPGGLEHLPNGDYRIAFIGTPGASYQIQWTQDIRTLPVNWQVLGSVVADPLGNILIDHANPPGTTLYYRAALE
jgi:autotransporter-associated beta strand protein